VSKETEIEFPVAGKDNPYIVYFPETDASETNPKLHQLYVKWACEHLVKIDAALAMFDACANLNMTGPFAMLADARKMLIATNKAYADADEIVRAMYDAKRALASTTEEN